MTWWPSTAIVAMESQYVGPGATCPTLALSHTSRAWLQSVVSFVELYNTNTGTTHPLTNAPVRRTPPGGYGQQGVGGAEGGDQICTSAVYKLPLGVVE